MEALQTDQHRRRGADRIFTTHCHVSGDAKPDMAELRAMLKKLETDLDVVCNLEVTSTRILHRSVSG